MLKYADNSFTRESLRGDVLPLEVRGVVKTEAGSSFIAILVWDVSEKGIGIWSPEKIPESSVIELELTTPYSGKFQGTVAWSEEHSNGFRLGIEVSSGLTELFILYSKFETARSELAVVSY